MNLTLSGKDTRTFYSLESTLDSGSQKSHGIHASQALLVSRSSGCLDKKCPFSLLAELFRCTGWSQDS